MEMTIHSGLTPETAASKFAALGSEQRLAVLDVLVRAGSEGLPIGVLGERCGISGSTLTHHLKILAAAGLVTQSRQGRSIICAGADYAEVRALSDYLLRHCCADASCATEHSHG
ncbi:transcriptional regulator [Sagittula sp. P11]|uniref:ArsR/SmtB family transcription factor n=1 Tax=Sagittula sp. P11 TaxID=2009329 RepID=UPI000C2D6331|nr:helix-turn-helix transcriptional regulator [Sagittula sp. P11]AUC53986.1 transcriptional regulator [Sagittula sp. P11]